MNIAEDMKKVTTNYTVKEDMIFSKIPMFLQSLSLWYLLGSISIIKSTKKFYFLCKPLRYMNQKRSFSIINDFINQNTVFYKHYV